MSPHKQSPSPAARLHSLEEQVTGSASALLPALRVELLENRQAVVDGCRGILESSDRCIRLSGGKLILRFTGSGMDLRAFREGSAIVSGRIASVEML